MRRLYRSDTDKLIGGVCGGLGEYLDFDPLVIRIIFVVMAMISGIGFAVYILMWLFIPLAHASSATQDEVLRQNVQEIRGQTKVLGKKAQETLGGMSSRKVGSHMLIAGVVLVGLGLLSLLRNFGLLAWVGKLWPLVLIAIGIVILLDNLRGRE